MRIQLIVAACLAGVASLGSQQPTNFDFSVASIMRGHDLVGREPENVRWSADSRWI
jgi:hypothetical protein